MNIKETWKKATEQDIYFRVDKDTGKPVYILEEDRLQDPDPQLIDGVWGKVELRRPLPIFPWDLPAIELSASNFGIGNAEATKAFERRIMREAQLEFVRY